MPDNAVLTMVLFDNKVTVVPLEIVGQHLDLSAVLIRLRVQPLQEVAHARVSPEADWTLVLLGFGHDKIRNVTSRVLHGLHVEEYV